MSRIRKKTIQINQFRLLIKWKNIYNNVLNIQCFKRMNEIVRNKMTRECWRQLNLLFGWMCAHAQLTRNSRINKSTLSRVLFDKILSNNDFNTKFIVSSYLNFFCFFKLFVRHHMNIHFIQHAFINFIQFQKKTQNFVLHSWKVVNHESILCSRV